MTLPTAQPPRKRAADETADRLRAAILKGEIAPGDGLPPERELAEQLGVSRLTLRSALAKLETEGLVLPVHGSGNKVLDFRETGGVELLGHLVTIASDGGELPVSLFADLLELRRIVAVEVVALAAERASARDLHDLRGKLAELARHVGDARAFMEHDLAFSRRVVEATHNLAFQLLTGTIIRVLENQPGIEAAFVIHPQGTLDVYDHVLSLVEQGKVEPARRAARRLLARLDANILERVRAFSSAGQEADGS